MNDPQHRPHPVIRAIARVVVGVMAFNALSPLSVLAQAPRVRIVVASIEPRTRGRRRRMEVARYGQTFKDRAVARLLPPAAQKKEIAQLDQWLAKQK